MGEHERELERVRRARADFESSQDEVERLKQEYFVSVRTLHEAGMPLREIASALGLSHQRVHQMVDEAGDKKSRLGRAARRVAKPGGVAMLVLLAAIGGYSVQAPELPPDKIDKQARSSACRKIDLVFKDGTKETLAPKLHFEPSASFCLPDPARYSDGPSSTRPEPRVPVRRGSPSVPRICRRGPHPRPAPLRGSPGPGR